MSIAQLPKQTAAQCRLSVLRQAGWLLLPRPWLSIDACGNSNERLYVKGVVLLGGRMIDLPYWHQVVRISFSV